jgi:tetratricopeptide (TPR) repeat protein
MNKYILIFLLFSFISEASISSSKKDQLKSKLIELEVAATNGDVNVQLFLSQVYLEGYQGITIDLEKGINWLEVAATDERPDLQEQLGEIFHYGYYGDRDFEKAIKWYLKSAKNGSAAAMDYVGLFYSGGLGGLKQNCKKAVEWFKKGLKGGFKQSKGNIVWALATCPDKSHRNGKEALTLALEIIENKGIEEAGDLDNLAAAYAENKDFLKAIDTQKKAITLVNPATEASRLEKFNLRLELYKDSNTWRGSSNAVPEDYGQ